MAVANATMEIQTGYPSSPVYSVIKSLSVYNVDFSPANNGRCMNEMKAVSVNSFRIPAAVLHAAILVFIFVINFFPNRQASPVIILSGLTVLIFTQGRFKRGFLRIVWPLLGILVLGVVGAPGHLLHDILRDISVALTPIALIFIGYWLGGRLGMRPLFFKVLVFGGLILAVFHLFNFVKNPELLSAGLEDVRKEAGTGNSLVPLSLILLIFQHQFGVGRFLPRLVPRSLAIVLLAGSLLLSYSRTDILVTIILLLSLFGSLSKINVRMLLAGLLIIGGIIGLIVTIPDGPIGTLRTKIMRSVDEVAISEYEDMAAINNNWRGFEAYRAVEGFKSANIVQKIFGQGFGALVDLGFYIQLGDVELQYIPLLHNGYAYILTKVGLLGLMLYAVFYFQVIRYGVRNSFSKDQYIKAYARLLIGCIWSLIMVMMFGGGMAQGPWPALVSPLGYLVHCIERFHRPCLERCNGRCARIR